MSEELLDLGCGDPYLHTPENVREAGKKAIDQGYTHYLRPPETLKLRRAVAEMLKREANINVEPAVVGVPYWTDGALLFSEANIPTVVCGPGNIAQAHSSVEFVSIDETLKATRVFMLTALGICC